MTPIRVLLADDHALMRAGIRASLVLHRHIQVIAEASDGEEAVRKAVKILPDIALLDVSMPKLSGLDAAKRLRRLAPSVKSIILTMHSDPEYLRQLTASGAKGYLLKDAPAQQVATAIEAVNRGRLAFSPAVQQAILQGSLGRKAAADSLESLTPRERQILILVADGASSREVAGKLGIGVRTVESHRDRVMSKLGLQSQAALTKFALSRGLIRL